MGIGDCDVLLGFGKYIGEGFGCFGIFGWFSHFVSVPGAFLCMCVLLVIGCMFLACNFD